MLQLTNALFCIPFIVWSARLAVGGYVVKPVVVRFQGGTLPENVDPFEVVDESGARRHLLRKVTVGETETLSPEVVAMGKHVDERLQGVVKLAARRTFFGAAICSAGKIGDG